MSVRYITKERAVLIDEEEVGVISIEDGVVFYRDKTWTSYTIEEMQCIVENMKDIENKHQERRRK